MDNQIWEMIRDRFDGIDSKIDHYQNAFDEHLKQDVKYWKKIDEQSAQLSVVKWLVGGAASAGGLFAWLYSKFGGH